MWMAFNVASILWRLKTVLHGQGVAMGLPFSSPLAPDRSITKANGFSAARGSAARPARDARGSAARAAKETAARA